MTQLAAGTFAYLFDLSVAVDQQGVLSAAIVSNPRAPYLQLVGFTPDHNWLAAYDTFYASTGTAVVWSADLTDERSINPLGTQPIIGATMHPTRNELVAYLRSGRPQFVDVASGTVVGEAPINTPYYARDMLFSPDGSLLAWGDGGGGPTPVYETTGWTQVASLASNARNLYFSPDGATLWLTASDGLRRYSTSDWSGSLFKAFSLGGPNSGTSVNAAGSMVLAFDRTETAAPAAWNTSTATLAYSSNRNAAYGRFLGESSLLVVSNDDTDTNGFGAVIDASDGSVRRRLLGYASSPPVVAPAYIAPAPVTPPFWTHFINTAETI